MMIAATSATSMAGSIPENSAYAGFRAYHPVQTRYGIVFTNETASALYLANGGKIEELFSGAGCGMYFTLSPDLSLIGFKDILSDGEQAPALLDISAKTVTLLHPPVALCGQVSFSSDSSLAYSIGDEVYIMAGALRPDKLDSLRINRRIPIGIYSNIVALSPDGEFVAYNDGRGYIHDIDLITGDNSEISGPGCAMPEWSPAGEKFCYSSLNGNLFVFDTRTRSTYALGSGTDPVWTPDGNSIVTVRTVVRRDSMVNSDLYEIKYDGSQTRQLTTTKSIFETDPSIGANGSVIFGAYNSNTIYSATLKQKALEINSSFEVNLAKLSPSGVESESPAPRAPSTTPNFEVPYINQVYDTPPSSLGDAACAPTAAMMVLAFYDILPPWDIALSIPTRHVSPYGNYVLSTYFFRGKYFVGGGYGYMWNTSDPYHMMVSYYDYNGLTASRLDSPSLDTVISEVDSGHPYTLCNLLTSVGHVIVINGVGSKYGTVIANDPYGNKNIGQWPNYSGKDVQYDWPGYNNGNQNLNGAAWGVSVRYAPPAIQDSIVDDLQFDDGFVLNNAPPASMLLWHDLNTGYDGHFWYTHTRAHDTCTALWRQPDSLQDGRYKLFAYIPSFSSRALGAGPATTALYRIIHGSDSPSGSLQEDSVVIDQSKSPNSWVSLGTYPFTKGDSGYVKLGDGSANVGQILEFDAIKWSYQSPLLVRDNQATPTKFGLEQNYPNPFNPTTNIKYQIASRGFVSLNIYDVLGRTVATLVNGRQAAGSYSVTFDAARFASGIYFYSLSVDGRSVVKKMMLLK